VKKFIFILLIVFGFADWEAKPTIRPFNDKEFTVVVTRGFGNGHYGIDFALITGTPVLATADGVVTDSRWFEGYGMTIILNHGEGIETLYGHLNEFLVLKGTSVKKGQLIGYSGNTGRSSGAHLHYGLKENGMWIWQGKYQRAHGITTGRIKQ
jgi:murein DD-endopeptidase MepM/ murein hydrolase activator NlpD